MELELNYAGFWKRFIAYVIDSIVVGAVLVAVRRKALARRYCARQPRKSCMRALWRGIGHTKKDAKQ